MFYLTVIKYCNSYNKPFEIKKKCKYVAVNSVAVQNAQKLLEFRQVGIP